MRPRRIRVSRRQRTLRARLIFATIALSAAVSVVIGLVSVISLQAFLKHRLDDQLTSAVRRSRVAADQPYRSATDRPVNPDGVPPLLAAVRARPTPRPGTGPGQFLLAPGQSPGTIGSRIDRDGNASAGMLDSAGSVIVLSSAQSAPLTTVPTDRAPHTIDLGGTLGSYRVLAQTTPSGETIITGLPLSTVRAAVYQLTAVVVTVGFLGLLAVALVGAAIIRRALRPLNRVAATATSVSELPLDRGEVALAVRVPDQDTDSNTEVGQVGAALNRMLGHVAGALQARQDSEARVRRFVADASHELRTPLASIRGYAELTRRSGQRLPADVVHALSRVESEAIRMTGLVEELLLLARLDDGRPSAQLPVDLSRLLVDALSDAHAAGPGHRWQLNLPEEPVEVCGDEPQLHQIIANLFANARVHTPPGSTVTVRLQRAKPTAPELIWPGDPGHGEQVAASRPEAVLEVTDNGPGISPDLLPEVFERFARGDSSRSRGTGSTGLGLSIVAAVVAAHGGRIGVSSRPGQTTFTLHLPLTAASADPDSAGPEPLADANDGLDSFSEHDIQVAARTSRATSSRSEENSVTA
jgi:two-component system OmpR family sensor kinase